MKYKITFSKRFKKHYKKLEKKEKEQVKDKIRRLVENPVHPSLRTKKLQGTDYLMESSINMDLRVLWYFAENEIIFLLDVGRHDILKRY